LPREVLRIGVHVQRLETGHQRANNKHGGQRVWDPRHRTGAEGVEAESQRRFKKTEKTTSRANLKYIASAGAVEAEMVLWEQVEAAELDEMWSFVGNKDCQRWLWLAIDRKTRAVLAYVFWQRKDKVFMELKARLSLSG